LSKKKCQVGQPRPVTIDVCIAIAKAVIAHHFPDYPDKSSLLDGCSLTLARLFRKDRKAVNPQLFSVAIKNAAKMHILRKRRDAARRRHSYYSTPGDGSEHTGAGTCPNYERCATGLLLLQEATRLIETVMAMDGRTLSRKKLLSIIRRPDQEGKDGRKRSAH